MKGGLSGGVFARRKADVEIKIQGFGDGLAVEETQNPEVHNRDT